MKFLISLIGITLLSTSLLSAQNCGSFATQADVIREKERSYANINQRVSASSVPLHFAVKFHIVTESDSSGAPDYSLVKSSYDTLNKKFSTLNVVFDTCSGSSYINNSAFYSFDAATQQGQIASLYDSANVINIYIVGTLWYGSEQLCGIVSQIYSTLSTNRLFVSQECLQDITLTHEMGHYFGLYHTFEVIWGEEDPNESNCNLTGDLLCDTPADTITGSVNSQCQYLGPYTRNYYGTTYTVHPLVDNIMSYYKTYNKECRTSFTTDQYARMTTWAQDPNNQGKYPCPPPRLPPPPVLSIEVYPIPAESFLTIKAANANLPMEFRIIDITGKVVYQNSLTSLLSQVDISGLSPGMYITQVMDSNNKSLLIKKIIKTSNP